MWKSMVQPEATDDNVIGRMRFECWIQIDTQDMLYLLFSTETMVVGKRLNITLTCTLPYLFVHSIGRKFVHN